MIKRRARPKNDDAPKMSRAELNALVESYLADGGKICYYPEKHSGIRNEEPVKWNS